MNVRFFTRTAGPILVAVCACNLYAGMLEETCNEVYRKLDSGPREHLKKSTESFSLDGKQYKGWVIRLSGNANKATEDQRPDNLFGLPLPYCPEGQLPAETPRSFLNKTGWCADKMADGPDGTSYRALKNNVFCAVEGKWDGGDDSEPTYRPSPRYDIVVKCAIRESGTEQKR